MRKVKPSDDLIIDVKNLDGKFRAFNDRKISGIVLERFYRLQEYLEHASGSDPVVIFKKVYNFVDFFMEREVYPYTVCRKGCAHCCKVPLTITFGEAAFIEWSHRKRNLEMTIPRDNLVPRDTVDDYCPFLDQSTGLCTTYESRPLNCRTFGTFDHHDNCVDPNTRHYIYTFESNKMLEHLREYLDKLHVYNGYGGSPDIRDYFK